MQLSLLFALQHWFRKVPIASNLYLTITGPSSARLSLTQIEAALRDCGLAVGLQRFDTTPETVEAAFHVTTPDTARLEQCHQRLCGLAEGVRVSYVSERDFSD